MSSCVYMCVCICVSSCVFVCARHLSHFFSVGEKLPLVFSDCQRCLRIVKIVSKNSDEPNGPINENWLLL